MTKRITNVEAVVTMSMTLLRYRVSHKIVELNSQTVEDTVIEITNLLNKEVYTVVLGERLQACVELCDRLALNRPKRL